MSPARTTTLAAALLLAACAGSEPEAPQAAGATGPRVLERGVTSTRGAIVLELPAQVPAAGAAVTLLRTGYGSGPGKLGVAGELDAVVGVDGDPGPSSGPDAIAAAPGGGAVVLDGLNGRLLVVAPGGETRSLSLGGEVLSGDVAVDPSGGILVLARGAPDRLLAFHADGSSRFVGPLPPGGGSLAIHAGAEGTPFLQDGAGRLFPLGPDGLAFGPRAAGIPAGRELFLHPVRLSRSRAAIRVLDAAGLLVREVVLRSDSVPIVELERVRLTTDGGLTVLLTRMLEDRPLGRVLRAERLLLRLGADGALVELRSLPLGSGWEAQRPVDLTEDGALLELHLGATEATVLRFAP